MIVATTRAELEAGLRALRADDGADRRPVALVPTMGALHAGHLSLVRAARADGDRRVVVTIFVNPLQFDAAGDLARYPVEHATDLARLGEAAVDLVWLPRATDVYPAAHATRVEVAGPALGFEGAARPGHFAGVATVVAILLGAVRPREAWFGEKDWQQLQVVRRLVVDLGLAVAIRAGATVRDADGLALSSRNRFIEAAARPVAPRLFETLGHVAGWIGDGLSVDVALARGIGILSDAGFAVDYLVLVRGASMEAIAVPEPGARLVAAARLGAVRLLDNVGLN